MTQIPHPREQEKFFGHDQHDQAFRKALQEDRLHHAWILAGPKSVGKATLAYRWARSLLSNPGLVAAQTHPDLFVIEGESWDNKGKKVSGIGVDAVRDLGQFIRLTSAFGGWKVIIIDDAQTMTTNAANALLKILEEPTAKTIIFLISTSVAQLLPTIRSRCHIVKFNPLPQETQNRLLQHLCPNADKDQLAEVQKLEPQNLDRCLTLLQHQDMQITHYVRKLFQQLPNYDAIQLMQFADKVTKHDDQAIYHLFTHYWVQGLQDLAKKASHCERSTSPLLQDIAITPTAPPKSILATIHACQSWLDKTDNFYLDKKQTLLTLINETSKIFR